MNKIKKIINDTPTITDLRKKFLIDLLTQRKKLLLEPALKRVLKNEKKISLDISKAKGKGIER